MEQQHEVVFATHVQSATNAFSEGKLELSLDVAG